MRAFWREPQLRFTVTLIAAIALLVGTLPAAEGFVAQPHTAPLPHLSGRSSDIASKLGKPSGQGIPNAGTPPPSCTAPCQHFIPLVCQFCSWAGSEAAFAQEYSGVSKYITDLAEEEFYLSSNLTLGSYNYDNGTQGLAQWSSANQKGSYAIITACDPNRITEFLETPSLWGPFAQGLVNASKNYSFTGYVLDFEPDAACSPAGHPPIVRPDLALQYADFADTLGGILGTATYFNTPMDIQLLVTVSPTNTHFWNPTLLGMDANVSAFLLQDYTCNFTAFQSQLYSTLSSGLLGGRLGVVLSPADCVGSPYETADLQHEVLWLTSAASWGEISQPINFLSYWALDDAGLAMPTQLWPTIGTFLGTNVFNETAALYANAPKACEEHGSVCILGYSEYQKWFMTNISFSNIFGVDSTEQVGPVVLTPIAMTATFAGAQSFSFAAPSPTTDPWNVTVDMSTLPHSGTFTIQATFANGKVLWQNLSIFMAQTPQFVAELFKLPIFQLSYTYVTTGEWNNTYVLDISTDFSLGTIFGQAVNLNWLSGQFNLLPQLSLNAVFGSGGWFSVMGSFTYSHSPSKDTKKCAEDPKNNSKECQKASDQKNSDKTGLDLASYEIDITVTLEAEGTFNLTNSGQVKWLSAYVKLGLDVSGSVTIPIYGIDLGVTTIGIDLVITIDPSITIKFILDATNNSALDFIPGFDVALQEVIGELDLALTVELQLNAGIASIGGGATLEFTEYLGSLAPYNIGGSITGTIFISYSAGICPICISGDLWSLSGTLYQWGNPPSNFAYVKPHAATGPPVRYYNTTGYNSPAWTTGQMNGTLVHNIYPETRVASASSGNQVYLLYTNDNVSAGPLEAMTLDGATLNTQTLSGSTLHLPPVPGGISMNPQVTTLPNGDLQAIWDTASYASLAANGFAGTPLTLETATYSPSTGTWSSPRAVTSTGIADSYQISTCGSNPEAAVFESTSPLSTTGALEIYDLASGTELQSRYMTGVQDVSAFSCSRQAVLLQENSGWPTWLNLTNPSGWVIPHLPGGWRVMTESLAGNNSPDMAVVYGSNYTAQDIINIYNVDTGALVATVDGTSSTTTVDLVAVGGIFYLGVATPQGVTVWEISPGHVPVIFATSFFHDLRSFGMETTDSSLVLWGLDNYGNQTAPLLDLHTQLFNVTQISDPVALPAHLDAGQSTTLSVVGQTEGGPSTYAWSGLPSGCVSRNASQITCTPSAAGTYAVYASLTDAAGYTVESGPVTLVVSPTLKVSGPTTTSTSFWVGNLTTLNASISGGLGPYVYQWGGLPSGCTGASVEVLPCYPEVAGSYDVTFNVSDANGATASGSVAFTVSSRPTSNPGGGLAASNPGGVTTPDLVVFLIGIGVGALVGAAVFYVVSWRGIVGRRPKSARPSKPKSASKSEPSTSETDVSSKETTESTSEPGEGRHAPGGGPSGKED